MWNQFAYDLFYGSRGPVPIPADPNNYHSNHPLGPYALLKPSSIGSVAGPFTFTGCFLNDFITPSPPPPPLLPIITVVTISGYRNGEIVATLTTEVSHTFTWIQANWQDIDSLYFSSNGSFLLSNLTVTSLPPDVATLAQVSSSVYNGNADVVGHDTNNNSTTYAYIDDNTHYIPDDSAANPGFRAAVYAGPGQDQIIIAFRGTDTSDAFNLIYNLAADVGFGGPIPSPRLLAYSVAAAHMIQAVYAENPTSHITLTGHSLGGALALAAGVGERLPAYGFNAPGAGLVYNILEFSSLQPLGNSTVNYNYRIFGDQISQFGARLPETTEVTLPWPDNGWPDNPLHTYQWLTNGSHPFTEFMANSTNIKFLHSMDTVRLRINNPPCDTSGEPHSAADIQQYLTGSVTGQIAVVLAGQLTRLIELPPVGNPQNIWLFIMNANTPGALSPPADAQSLSTVVLPVLSSVVSYNVRYQIGAVWSSFVLVQPGSVYQFPPGSTGMEFVPLDADGNAFSLPSCMFALTFSSAGNVSANATGTTTAPSLPPFQKWQVQQFGYNASNPSVASDTANPSGDGVINLMKYALGMNPNVNVQLGMPFTELTTIGGSNYCTLSYTKVNTATDVTYHPEWSNDLVTWWNTGLIEQVVSDNGTIQQVQDSFPVNGAQAKFLRLRVTHQ